MIELEVRLPGLVAQESEPAKARSEQLRSLLLQEKLVRCAMKGFSAKRAAGVCGCHESTARAFYRDPGFRKRVNGIIQSAFEGVDEAFVKQQEGIHEKLERAALVSFDELYGMLTDKGVSSNLRARIAMQFLDRNPETQTGSTLRVEKVEAEQLLEAAKVAREMEGRATELGKVVEMRKKEVG